MSGLYAIRLDDGRLITDPTWHSVADVMRGAHGQGVTRVVGKLVRLDPPLMKHHPTLLSTGRHGCWATCRCGWRSATWRTVVGAHLDFGHHLVEHPNPKETP